MSFSLSKPRGTCGWARQDLSCCWTEAPNTPAGVESSSKPVTLCQRLAWNPGWPPSVHVWRVRYLPNVNIKAKILPVYPCAETASCSEQGDHTGWRGPSALCTVRPARSRLCVWSLNPLASPQSFALGLHAVPCFSPKPAWIHSTVLRGTALRSTRSARLLSERCICPMLFSGLLSTFPHVQQGRGPSERMGMIIKTSQPASKLFASLFPAAQDARWQERL